jgi:negative regulator of flagellin synthesis FlgM
MKIEAGRPNTEGVGTQRVEQQNVDRATKGGRQADTTGSDSVRLSSDAQLATEAAREAAAAPAIRQDKVEAARKALEAGKVGNDPIRLADKMIDSLLGN